jgi:peptidoglycan/LPS O-acetylase OafA/YrhL
MSHRNAHYWLWFLIFGVVAGILSYKSSNPHTLSSESIWLLVTGLLGIMVGADWFNSGKFAKGYDLIVGIIFAAVGILGILLQFGLFHISTSSLPSGLISNNALLGLSLSTFPALIHTVLGLDSINHGLKAK